MRGYFQDKRSHPWHRIVMDIEKYSPKGKRSQLGQTMMLLRSGVFAALGILSLVAALDTSTAEILKVFTSGLDWSSGKREVRSFCSNTVHEMIKNGDLRHLLPSALERDGFGYLIQVLEDAKWEEFNKAKPSIKRGNLNLHALEKSIIGSRFLGEQGVIEFKISKDDPRVPLLLEAYEHSLVEYEIERRSRLPLSSETEQVTLNGGPIETEDKPRERRADTKTAEDIIKQPELTDFIEENSTARSSKTKNKAKKTRGK